MLSNNSKSSNNSKREQVLEIIKKEGNRHAFYNEKSGYYCLLRRSETTQAWCGYVELPKDHPFHDLDYDEITAMKEEDVKIDVHGGLSYAQDGFFGFDCSHYGDYYILMDEDTDTMGKVAIQVTQAHEMMRCALRGTFYQLEEGDDDGYQEITYKDKEYALKECNKLAEQLFSYKDRKKE